MAEKRRSQERTYSETVDPNEPYPMHLPRLGHAVIVNNIASELPGSMRDVTALETAFTTVGFTVHIHRNCTDKQMRKLRQWIIAEETHRDSNTFALAVIAHGNQHGHLFDKDRGKAWDTELLVKDLSYVETLAGKPKIIVIQSCRGTDYNVVRRKYLANEENETPSILPHKIDMLLAFATVPGYKAHAGDENGSMYLQTFAKYLQKEYMKRPLDQIFLMVRMYMYNKVQGDEGMKQCPEERNTLTHCLKFSEFHRESKAEETDLTDEPATEETDETNRKAQAAEDLQVSPPATPTAPPRPPARHSSLKRETSESGDVYKAKYDFQARNSLEVSMNVGDVIIDAVKAKYEGFVEGTVRRTGERGCLPQNYLHLIQAEMDEDKSDAGNQETPEEKTDERIERNAERTTEEKYEDTTEEGSEEQTVQPHPVLEKRTSGKSTFYTDGSTETLKPAKEVNLSVLSTHDTELEYRDFTKIAVLPSSGTIVFFGKTHDSELSFHLYDKRNEALVKRNQKVAALCRHRRCDALLPIVTSGKEQLAVSCLPGNKIRLLDVKTRIVSEAFYESRYSPTNMCHGENGQIYATHSPRTGKLKLLLFNCNQSEFTVGKPHPTGLKQCWRIAYIPVPYRLIAMSHPWEKGLVRAVFCDTGEVAWDFPGLADGTAFNPRALLYSPQHDSVLVGDFGRVVVLHPGDGSHLRTVFLQGLGEIWDMCLHNNQIIVHHVLQNNHKISYLSVT